MPARVAAMLVLSRSISPGAESVRRLRQARDARQEHGHEIVARKVVRRSHAQTAEQRLEQLR